VKPFQISQIVLFALLICCTSSIEKEKKEFKELEISIAVILNARAENRGIRLNELKQTKVTFDSTKNLKSLCVSSFRSFENASILLKSAKDKTNEIENEIKEANKRKSDGETISQQEQEQLLTLSKYAATSLNKVSKEIDKAESLVNACENAKTKLKHRLYN